MKTRRPPPRAVVFDLDGTLVDSHAIVLEALAHGLESYGRKPGPEIFATLGGPPERFLLDLVYDPKHVPVVIERMTAFYRTNGHVLRLYTGVSEMFAALAKAGVRIGVWTGRDRASADLLLQHHGLASAVRAMICGDDLPTHKPNPDGLRKVLSGLGVGAPDTLYVGDADVDVQGGAACGVDTLLIRGHRVIPEPLQVLSWGIVDTPKEAYSMVLASVSGESISSAKSL